MIVSFTDFSFLILFCAKNFVILCYHCCYLISLSHKKTDLNPILLSKKKICISPNSEEIIATYDLYGHMHNAFDAGDIHYKGKGKGVGPWN
jgi:hypothetical protein